MISPGSNATVGLAHRAEGALSIGGSVQFMVFFPTSGHQQKGRNRGGARKVVSAPRYPQILSGLEVVVLLLVATLVRSLLTDGDWDGLGGYKLAGRWNMGQGSTGAVIVSDDWLLDETQDWPRVKQWFLLASTRVYVDGPKRANGVVVVELAVHARGAKLGGGARESQERCLGGLRAGEAGRHRREKLLEWRSRSKTQEARRRGVFVSRASSYAGEIKVLLVQYYATIESAVSSDGQVLPISSLLLDASPCCFLFLCWLPRVGACTRSPYTAYLQASSGDDPP